ncbi:MAG: GspMb/PilO family protein [Verrucomicrobiota bacterium]
MKRLSARERIMVAVVAAILFVLGNMALLSSLAERHRQLSSDLATKNTELAALKTILSDREQGAKRDAWLTATQPKLTNQSQAGVVLLDQVRQVAKASDVLLENPEIGSMDSSQPTRQSVTVMIQTKSSWAALVKFLNGLQQPDQFIVFESANFQSDSTDPAQMRGRLRIAKWYAR